MIDQILAEKFRHFLYDAAIVVLAVLGVAVFIVASLSLIAAISWPIAVLSGNQPETWVSVSAALWGSIPAALCLAFAASLCHRALFVHVIPGQDRLLDRIVYRVPFFYVCKAEPPSGGCGKLKFGTPLIMGSKERNLWPWINCPNCAAGKRARRAG